jgi:hypothetical protein
MDYIGYVSKCQSKARTRGAVWPRCGPSRSAPHQQKNEPQYSRLPLAESNRSFLHKACHPDQSRRQETLQALAYGHCGKKFAAKVPGEVSHSPAPGAVTLTSV